MSLDLETDDKPGKIALGCGAVLGAVSAVAATALWSLPTLTRGAIGGDALGLPISGAGACGLSFFGGLLALWGAMMLTRQRRRGHSREPYGAPLA